MDISTFRWILIIGGLALIAIIFLFGSPDRRKQRASRRKNATGNRRKARASSGADARREPTLGEGDKPGRFDDPELDAPEATDPPTHETGQGELAIEPSLDPPAEPAADEMDMPPLEPMPAVTPEPQTVSEPPPQSLGPPPDKIIALYLQARDNQSISGLDLLDSALKSGMEFGFGDIFHRKVEGSEQPVFSMANLVNPGTFDKAAWNTLETRGVTMIMIVPGPMSALDAWDAMLGTSRRLAELLHADLKDSSQEIFTRQREGEIRQELREYERSQLPEG